MAFWSRWFGGQVEQKYDTLDLLKDLYGSAAAKAGVEVSWATAMQCSVAFACARVIANGLSQVPFRLMRQRDGRREPARDHPLFDLFEWAPNDWQTSTELMEQLALHLVFAGRAVVWTNRARGRIAELLPLEPGKVQVVRDGWENRYQVDLPDGKRSEIPRTEIWHLRGPSWNGWEGLDGVKLAREAIGLAVAAEGHGASGFKNGPLLSGILTTNANLTKDQREQLRDSFMAAHSGDNAGRVAIMSNGMQFVAAGQNNASAQWNETRRMQTEEVCRAFGVMPIMVGYSDKAATYASAEQMFIAHVVHTLGPWYARIEQSAAVNLLTPEERRQGYYFKFFTQALLRGASKDRADYWARLHAIGVYSANEIRALEDMNPYPGGDTFVLPLNMQMTDGTGRFPAASTPSPDPALDPDPADA